MNYDPYLTHYVETMGRTATICRLQQHAANCYRQIEKLRLYADKSVLGFDISYWQRQHAWSSKNARILMNVC